VILEKYIPGEGWFIVSHRDFDSVELAVAYARALVYAGQTRPGVFRVSEFGEGHEPLKVLRSFGVGAEAELFS
jgi:hypothetical protein